MSAGDGYFTFTNSELSNDFKTSYCKDADSHIIDNKGDSGESTKQWDSNFSERLANFMKNSKSLLENIDKKHNTVKFQPHDPNGSKEKSTRNDPESPTDTLNALEETLLHMDDTHLRHIQRNDNKRSSEPSSKVKISIDSNEKENISESGNAENKLSESQSKKYVASKNHNFQEALRIDELENELNKMKTHMKEKDKKITVLESVSVVSSTPSRVNKPAYKNIGTEVNSASSENSLFTDKKQAVAYRDTGFDNKPFDEFLINSSNKMIYDGDNNGTSRQFNDSQEYSSIKDYNPNHSLVLRNKIKDLESQIQDLQEANENASQIMSSLKQRSQMETSNNTHSMVQELIEKNKILREEVDRLHQSIPALKGDTISSQFLRQELENLKEDLYALKQQNNLIVMENISLKSQMKKKENIISMPNKYEDRNPTLIEHIKPNQSIYTDAYELNNHSKVLSDSDESMYIPPNSVVSNNQSKAMSMTNISTNQNNTQKVPKKVRKIFPQSNKKKVTQKPELFDHAYTENDVNTDKLLGRMGGDNTLYGREAADLSNDSTDSILSDANKEMQDIIFKSEVDNTIQSYSTKAKYDKIFVEEVQYDKSFSKNELKESAIEPTNPINNKFSTLGRTAYAPRSSYDINIGDVVKFIRQGGCISRGLVHYVGPLPNRKDTYLGIELEIEDGKHDGIYEGKRYFQCIKNKGVFVAFNKIIMVYSRKM